LALGGVRTKKRHGKMPDSVMHKNATAVVIVANDRDQLRIFPHLSLFDALNIAERRSSVKTGCCAGEER